jgi:hypothetical protein
MLALIRKCCRLQLYFDATYEEAEYISQRSLDQLVKIPGGADDPRALTPVENWRAALLPSFSMNRIRRISGAQNHAILLWNFNKRFSNPSHVAVPYVSNTKEEYERIESRPLPRRPVPAPQTAPVRQSPKPVSQAPTYPQQTRSDALEAAYKALVAVHLAAKQPVSQLATSPSVSP